MKPAKPPSFPNVVACIVLVAACGLLIGLGVLNHVSDPAGNLRLIAYSGPSCGSWLGSAPSLPTAASGGFCGDGIAKCSSFECCDQYGRCQLGDKCGETCLCALSGRYSACRGGLNTFFKESPRTLPLASPAGLCSASIARCPDGQCCTESSYCSSDPKICSTGICHPGASGSDMRCNAVAYPRHHSFEFNLTWGERTVAGITRNFVLVNGQYPSPAISVTEGDTVSVRVHNALQAPTGIHWHGMVQFRNNIMDGVVGLTQRPLPHGQSQLYTFTADLHGTYWYHSHYMAQYMDGLRGVIEVKKLVSSSPASSDPQGNIRPTPMLLADIYATTSGLLLKRYLDGQVNPDGDEPVPQAAVIDGIGQYNCSGTQCSFKVVQGVIGRGCSDARSNLRLAFVNGGGFATFMISVDDHLMFIDALDAVTVSPSTPTHVVAIAPGQRIAVYVCPASLQAAAKAEMGGSFYINATMIQSVFSEDSPNPTALAVLQYGTDATHPTMPKLPTSGPWNITPIEVTELLHGVRQQYFHLSSPSIQGPPAPTRTFTFEILPYQDNTPTSSNLFHFNNISMAMPFAGPTYLEQALSRTLANNSNLGPNIIDVDPGDVVQMIFNNGDDGTHPLHFHGHWMWIMRQGDADEGYYNQQPLEAHPIQRDTVEIQGNSSLVVRWVADNPGMWVLHCHIDWHMAAGLMMIIRYGI